MQDRDRPRHAPRATGALTARDAAAALGISARTVRRAIKRGDIPATKFAGVFQISPAALARYRRSLTAAPVRAEAPVPLLRLAPTVPPPKLSPPVPITSFIGREPLIAEVVATLRQPEVRLLTLIGPGGVGKTRVAIAIAERLRPEFAYGAGFIPLASMRDVELVMPTIARYLGLGEGDRDSPLQSNAPSPSFCHPTPWRQSASSVRWMRSARRRTPSSQHHAPPGRRWLRRRNTPSDQRVLPPNGRSASFAPVALRRRTRTSHWLQRKPTRRRH